MLRKWQIECIDLVEKKFAEGRKEFLCVATPGAGKTVFSAVASQRLINKKKVEFVLCLTPSIAVMRGVQDKYEEILQKPLDGKFGSIGLCMTYQSFQYAYQNLAERLSGVKVLLVLDEIHHCAGINEIKASAWARPLLYLIEKVKPYVLSLSGTPFRSDMQPITTLKYDGSLVKPDYIYGLQEATRDDVCRSPVIYLIDNTKWRLTQRGEVISEHNCLSSLLEQEQIAYQRILEDRQFMTHMLSNAEERLKEGRRLRLDQGGLVVASSINHARQITQILYTLTNEQPTLVTSDDPDCHSKLIKFKNGTSKWLVSVGMVSEGTDIPRLQVCCYLSRIRTKLHFRQVLGRILRVRNNETESVAELIIPAHFELLMFAKRLSEEIPESADLIKYCKFDITKPETNDLVNDSKKQISLELDTLYEKGNELQVNPVNPAEDFISARKHKMADTNVGVYGLYIEEVMRYCQ